MEREIICVNFYGHHSEYVGAPQTWVADALFVRSHMSFHSLFHGYFLFVHMLEDVVARGDTQRYTEGLPSN